MGIESVKVNGTTYPISPLVYTDTDRVVGSIGETDLISKRYHFTGNEFSVTNEGHGAITINISKPSITEGQRTQMLDNIVLITYIHYVTTSGSLNLRTNERIQYSSGMLKISYADDWNADESISLPSGTMDTTSSYMDILILTTQAEV